MLAAKPAKARGLSFQAQSRGPVGAAVAAAFTLGWQHAEVLKWRLPTGEAIDLAHIDPRERRQLVNDQAGRWLWAQAAGRHKHPRQLDGQPCLAPLRKLVGQVSPHTAKQKGLLKAILAGDLFRATWANRLMNRPPPVSGCRPGSMPTLAGCRLPYCSILGWPC